MDPQTKIPVPETDNIKKTTGTELYLKPKKNENIRNRQKYPGPKTDSDP